MFCYIIVTHSQLFINGPTIVPILPPPPALLQDNSAIHSFFIYKLFFGITITVELCLIVLESDSSEKSMGSMALDFKYVSNPFKMIDWTAKKVCHSQM